MFWKNLIKSKDSILKGGLVLFLGMTLASFGNYLFNMIMGRMLGPQEYGGLVALMALLTIIGVPSATLQTAVMKFVSSFKAKANLAKTNFLLRYLIGKTIIISVVIIAVLLISSFWLKGFLNISSVYPLVILSSAIIFMFLLPINRGAIQGGQDFSGLSATVILEPILKILAGILLIYFGFKLSGAALAILAGNALVYLFSFNYLKDIFKNKSESFKIESFWKYSLPTLLAIFFLSILTYADVIIVKHYLSPDQAGLYSCLSTVAKIVLYFSLPFIQAMFPKISYLYTKREKHFSVLAQTFVVVSFLSLAVMVFFILWPDFSIKILFGQAYLAVSPYLGGLSFAMFLLALINVFINYYLSIGKLFFIVPLFIFSLSEIILLAFFHADFNQIVSILTGNFAGLLITLGVFYIYSKKNQIIYVISSYSRPQ